MLLSWLINLNEGGEALYIHHLIETWLNQEHLLYYLKSGNISDLQDVIGVCHVRLLQNLKKVVLK